MTNYTYTTLKGFAPSKEKRFTNLLTLHKACYSDFPISTVFYAYKYSDIDMETYKNDLVLYRKLAKEHTKLFDDGRKINCHLDEQAALQAFCNAKSMACHSMMVKIESMA